MTSQEHTRPSPLAPAPDVDSAFFWQGLKEQRLLLQQCSDCKRYRFPPMPSCPYCAARESTVEEVGGNGSIYSWIVVHHAFDPAFASEVPYTLATIDLAEGGRLVGRLEGARAEFGMPVCATYTAHPDWTELRFRPRRNSE